MYRRFRDSLIYPRQILNFRNDRLWLVFLYIVLFAVLLSTKTIIDIVNYDGLTVASKEVIAQEFQELNPDCQIVDSEYTCADAETTLFYEDILITYYFESHSELQIDTYSTGYNIVVFQDSMYLIFRSTIVYEELLANLPTDFHNLEFALQTTDEDQFNERIFAVVDEFMMSYKPMWAPIMAIIDFFTGFFLFMVFIMISAWMLRVRFRQIPFRQVFAMTAYSSTGLYVILIFNRLFSLNFLVVVFLIFFAFRQNNQLSLEIVERLQKKP